MFYQEKNVCSSRSDNKTHEGSLEEDARKTAIEMKFSEIFKGKNMKVRFI